MSMVTLAESFSFYFQSYSIYLFAFFKNLSIAGVCNVVYPYLPDLGYIILLNDAIESSTIPVDYWQFQKKHQFSPIFIATSCFIWYRKFSRPNTFREKFSGICWSLIDYYRRQAGLFQICIWSAAFQALHGLIRHLLSLASFANFLKLFWRLCASSTLDFRIL